MNKYKTARIPIDESPAAHCRVTEVRSNFKSHDLRIFEIPSDKVLIMGPNGSGKSSILQTIEATLTGRCTDVGARGSARSASILEMGTTDGLEMSVVLSNGRSVAWRPTFSTHNVRANTQRPVISPWVDVRAAMSGGRMTSLPILYQYFAPHWDGKLWNEFNDTKKMVAAVKKEAKRTVTAREVLSEMLSEFDPSDGRRVSTLNAFHGLLRLQTKATRCASCGQEANPAVFAARLSRVEASLEENEGVLDWDRTQEVIATLEAKEAEAQERLGPLSERLEALVDGMEDEIKQHKSEIVDLVSYYLDQRQQLVLDFSTKNPRIGIASVLGEVRFLFSGAEGVQLTAAICAGIAEANLTGHPERDPLTLIICEDRAMTKKTYSKIFRALRGAPAQVFVQALAQPQGKLPAPWKALRLGK